MTPLRNIIEKAYKNIKEINAETIDNTTKSAILEVIQLLDQGKLRVAEKQSSQWVVQPWVKEAILLSFRINPNELINAAHTHYFDKIPLKFSHYDKQQFQQEGLRIVPNACVRQGAYIAKNTVLMPSFVNIGAYIDEGSMIDTWATVGSCAQIGKHVHLSGGVGIGGVLEPLQASPVIIEDGCFIGSRSIVVEGVRVEKEAVLGANVVLTQSTKIIDVSGSEPIEFKGKVPARSVVIPGSYIKKFPAGEYNVSCALIIGKRKPSTDLKTSLNDALRDFNVSV